MKHMHINLAFSIRHIKIFGSSEVTLGRFLTLLIHRSMRTIMAQFVRQLLGNFQAGGLGIHWINCQTFKSSHSLLSCVVI